MSPNCARSNSPRADRSPTPALDGDRLALRDLLAPGIRVVVFRLRVRPEPQVDTDAQGGEGEHDGEPDPERPPDVAPQRPARNDDREECDEGDEVGSEPLQP